MFSDHRRAVRVLAATVVFGLAGTLAVSTARGTGPNETPDARGERIIHEADQKVRAKDFDAAAAATDAVWKTRSSIPDDVALAAIRNTDLTPETRTFMVDVLAGKNQRPVANDKVKGLLRDHAVDDAVKVKVLVDFEFEPGDAAMLQQLTQTDDALGFHALKKLSEVEPAAGVDLARQFLKQPLKMSDLRISGAFKAVVRSNQFKQDPALRNELIAWASEVLQGSAFSASAKESATFALAETRSMSSLKIILDKQTDPIMIAGAVDENAQVLLEVLTDCVDPADVTLVAGALMTHPINELADPLTNCARKLGNKQISEAAKRVAARTATDGTPLNTKWGKE